MLGRLNNSTSATISQNRFQRRITLGAICREGSRRVKPGRYPCPRVRGVSTAHAGDAAGHFAVRQVDGIHFPNLKPNYIGLLIISSSFSWYVLAKGINVKPGFFSAGYVTGSAHSRYEPSANAWICLAEMCDAAEKSNSSSVFIRGIGSPLLLESAIYAVRVIHRNLSPTIFAWYDCVTSIPSLPW